MTLNGVNFAAVLSGTQEFCNLLDPALISGGKNVFSVIGTTGGWASFLANLVFPALPAFPEPTTWTMMLVGFGAVGYSMRKRTSKKLQLA